MSIRPQDLWDVLGNLQVQSTPDSPDASGSTITDLQAPPADVVQMTDTGGVTNERPGHNGIYKWNDAQTFWGLAQWG